MTPEHAKERLGKLTASRFADAIAKTKTGWGASRTNLIAALIAERLTEVPQDNWQSKEMQWGIEHEAEARNAYEFYQDVTVELVEFVPHPTIPMCGASPDGKVNGYRENDGSHHFGLVEIKAPNTATHIDTLLRREIPSKYVTQMMWQMACTGAMWCDWVSFDPRMPEQLRLYVERLNRDDKMILEMENDARAFLGEVDAKLAALTSLLQRKAA